MFRKMKQNKLLPTQEKFDTLIGATTEIYGRLVLLDSVRIDGKVIGNIETAKDKKVTVAIGRSGEVSGDITAHSTVDRQVTTRSDLTNKLKTLANNRGFEVTVSRLYRAVTI